MADHSITAAGDTGPIPADDPQRQLTVTAPDDGHARHIAQVGNTYTILVPATRPRGVTASST